MRVSEILNEGVEQFLDLAPSIEGHLENVDNPHEVTKEKIGLGNVTNDLQAKDADFRSHKDAAVLDHPAGSVTTEKLAAGAVTAEKIAAGAVKSGALAKGCVADAHLAYAVRKTISDKVDKVSGMGLSQNSFTDEEKAKLGAITVVDEEQHVLDAAKLVLNSEPLKLCKTGLEYISRGESVIASDVAELIAVDTDDLTGDIIIAYRDTADVYTIRWYQKGNWYTIKTSTSVVCHYHFGLYVYFAAQNENVVSLMRCSTNGYLTTVGTCTLSQTGDIEVRNIFVTSHTHLRVIYYKHDTSYTRLYVDKFKFSEDVVLWTVSQMMRRKSTYDTPLTYNDSIYKKHFRSAVMDTVTEDLYLAPVMPGTSYYSILRVNKDGEVTGRYRQNIVTSNTVDVMQDLALIRGKLYAFSGHPDYAQICCFDPDSGQEVSVWREAKTRLRGLSMDYHERVYLLTEKTTGETVLHTAYIGHGKMPTYYPHTMDDKQSFDGQYLLGRLAPDGFRLFVIPEESTELVCHLYAPADVYTVA